MALGATPRSVARLVIAQSMKPALAGAVIGLLIAVWVGRALEAMLFQVSASDPRALGASVAGVLVVALLASWLPAQRAMRTDPCRALRET
jgi:ABC-type lipoprotein release transport system permease subunit